MNRAKDLFTGILGSIGVACLILGAMISALAEAPAATRLEATPSVALPADFVPIIAASPTSLPTQAPLPTACIPPAGWQPYVIQAGDQIDLLASRWNIDKNTLLQANCLIIESLLPGAILYGPPVPSTPTPDQSLPSVTPTRCTAPVGWISYHIQSGDTLSSIGRAYGVSVYDLQQANCMGNSYLIITGNTLFVPNVATRTPVVAPSNTSEPTGTTAPSATSVSTVAPTATATATATAPEPTVESTVTSEPAPTDLPTSTLNP